jgi:hypothetical protein
MQEIIVVSMGSVIRTHGRTNKQITNHSQGHVVEPSHLEADAEKKKKSFTHSGECDGQADHVKKQHY